MFPTVPSQLRSCWNNLLCPVTDDLICFPTYVTGLMPFHGVTLHSEPYIIISADVPPDGLEYLPAGAIS